MPSNRAVAARAEQILVYVTVAGLLVLAFIFTPGIEMFRTAKEAAMRAQAILSLFLLAVAIAYGGGERLRELLRERAVLALLGGAVAWTAITTLTSGHRTLSIDSLVTVICSVVLFVAAWYVAPKIPLPALLILVPAVVVNTLLAALQEYGIWNPFTFAHTDVQLQHLASSALIGNPNDVGGYLALCTVVLLTATGFLRGRLRWVCAFGGAVALIGVFVSQTRTAAIALAATMIFVALRRSWKVALAVAGVLVVLLLLATKVNLPVLSRLAMLPSYIAQGHWDVVFSDRLPAFATAYAMFRDHPLLGVGPGAYKYFYLSYRGHLTETYREDIMRGAPVNFAEAHNDHLQLLAETGVPGYALFLAACVILGLRARHPQESEDERPRFASRLALPLVVTVAVLALAFFPLQIAVTQHLLVTMAALIISWSRP